MSFRKKIVQNIISATSAATQASRLAARGLPAGSVAADASSATANLPPHLKPSTTWWDANYAINVFTPEQLKNRVPKSVFKAYVSAIKENHPLDDTVADVVATALKDWAVSRGATHYTHWFQPIQLSTAEKHDSFVSPIADHRSILEFSGKELIRGESDASSFPNGGLRNTAQARGYTAWDPSSPAFIRNYAGTTTLYIPCIFCSWTGEALDVKAPLLRSIDALSKQTTRLLKLIGDTKVASVQTSMGPEQEFFLIDRHYFLERPDLMLSGRTVLGSKPAKGQELEDHYFARMNTRVLEYITEVEQELWRLGMPAKSRHNEVAPSQHEMSPIFEDANLAIDHNNISMELMKEIAAGHNLACLLHEKPFAGVNGSGKHNNWSIITDYGLRLLHPGAKPENNVPFLLTLAATIAAVDKHADVLRASIVTPGNDFRLGANEAPPAIISIYLGDDLIGLLDNLIDGKSRIPLKESFINIANPVSPIKKDTADRNRTSPFAFTGNKFEFRAVGSSQNVGVTCTFLNAIVADAVSSIADEVEKRVKSGTNPEAAGKAVALETIKAHRRIIYEGNGYTEDWVKEAEARGLPNYKESVSALEQLDAPKNIKLFEKLNILNEGELKARKHIFLEYYSKTINIEGLAAHNLVNTRVIPASLQHQAAVAQSILTTRHAAPKIDLSTQEKKLDHVTNLINNLINANQRLEDSLNHASDLHDDVLQQARAYRDEVKTSLEEVRKYSDALEDVVSDDLWTIPKYSEILYIK
eukprot:TRINITY_DN17737_c0_g1_i1.p1 TRINITY_DN17737_c0_g1~~TRINITY_DN17737_c0_g1_i1.p1  ORF type:complete len:757 (-),score=162.30 TRINITY_DN17737_c0_g1_i1:68-2338(-)